MHSSCSGGDRQGAVGGEPVLVGVLVGSPGSVRLCVMPAPGDLHRRDLQHPPCPAHGVHLCGAASPSRCGRAVRPVVVSAVLASSVATACTRAAHTCGACAAPAFRVRWTGLGHTLGSTGPDSPAALVLPRPLPAPGVQDLPMRHGECGASATGNRWAPQHRPTTGGGYRGLCPLQLHRASNGVDGGSDVTKVCC